MKDLPLSTAFPDSSAVDRATYHSGQRVLDIWYAGGDRYSYFDVPPEIYRQLRSAPSVGEFVNREVKPRFRCAIDPRRGRFRPRED
jgi:hypothetical protein